MLGDLRFETCASFNWFKQIQNIEPEVLILIWCSFYYLQLQKHIQISVLYIVRQLQKWLYYVPLSIKNKELKMRKSSGFIKVTELKNYLDPFKNMIHSRRSLIKRVDTFAFINLHSNMKFTVNTTGRYWTTGHPHHPTYQNS